ncbi:TRL-like family protein [Leptospira fletcheri]|uniref:TRL-like family protein n=1 Tax=Leptospira fletcheri TaxID=2484981 RepID=A0A4R9GC80_9LEPT|nr:TRL-like family protein [Leptospira fletcheri]TGK08760.1 TRL-like family protein [Leptospira fletcheri]
MGKKSFLYILLLGSFVQLFDCAPIGPSGGFLFSDYKFPGEINSSNNIPTTKKAEGCQYNVLSVVTWGSASAGRIAMENRITRIATIDHSTMSILYLYQDYCTIITGE